ncbi:basic leucine zipper transcriptional factor ATF-like [Dendrobates tinctorius]|uniref:basic leucine zipper transcriptional factor ATF-like n=1 Tax=Dendrobates tinctorius TaxID=92724 RepID=UPI003CCA595F
MSLYSDSSDKKKVQRREKNRIAAQKSRQRQTQKADTLHESENLERLNAALRREVRCLRDELKYLTRVLSSHQSVCTLPAEPPPLHPPATSTDT